MKTLLLTAITTLLLGTVTAQQIKVNKKFLSFKHSKFSIGVGLETGVTSAFMINAAKPDALRIIHKDVRKEKQETPYASVGLVFDLYSANSVVGLLGGFDFSGYDFGVQKGDSTVDFFTTGSVEVPLYLKFRIGKLDSRNHMWFLAGAVYNFPQSCKREQYNAKDGLGAYTTIYDESKEQLRNYLSLAGSLGYEFFIGKQKHFRGAVYSRVVFPTQNVLNPDYAAFKSTGNSVVRTYPDFDIRTIRISVGLKFMFQFGEAVQIMSEAVKSR